MLCLSATLVGAAAQPTVTALNAWADGGDVVLALSLSGGTEPEVVEVDGAAYLLSGLTLGEPLGLEGPFPLRRAELNRVADGVRLELELVEPGRVVDWRWEAEVGLLRFAIGGEAEVEVPRADELRLRRIVLDPGHGGRWTGAGGVSSGVFEKDLVLEIARELAELLEGELGCEVELTRDGDYAVGLRERARLADEPAADLFVSVHLNGGPPGMSGSEVYVPEYRRPQSPWSGGGGYRAGLELEDRGPWLLRWEAARLLAGLHFEVLDAGGAELADGIQRAQLELLGRADRGVKTAPFFVIVEPRCPAVLTESLFLSDREEEALVLDPAYRGRIARALCRGIVDWVRARQQLPDWLNSMRGEP